MLHTPSSHAAGNLDSPAPRPFPARLGELLASRFGARYSRAMAVRAHHGSDESPFLPVPPDAVVHVENTAEVEAVVQLCQEYGVPVIPYGVGSSLEGHLLAVQGGITLNCSGMNRVLDIRPEDLTATVEPGVTRLQLNAALKDTGLFFPIDPGADASIGGMTATRASGTNAVRYGTMRENVLALEVVTADGTRLRTGTRARKSSAGYDLTRLFVGSEGTLGVITEVTVRLHPQPESVAVATATFPDARSAVESVIQTIQMGVPVARCEFLDPSAVDALNAYSKLDLRSAYTLFFEFHGSDSAVQEQVQTVQEVVTSCGGADFAFATRQEERTRLWTARHNAYFACLQMRPGSRAISTDTCVPISRLAESLEGARVILEESGFRTAILGHVGDGNFHCVILVNPQDPEEMARAEAVNARIVRLALSLDGTCTGEHGVGLHKMGFLREEAGEAALDVMRSVKHALDPAGIMNPGKIFS